MQISEVNPNMLFEVALFLSAMLLPYCVFTAEENEFIGEKWLGKAFS